MKRAKVTFEPKAGKLTGGLLVIHETPTIDELFQDYLDWLLTQSKDRACEFTQNPGDESIFIGTWDVRLADGVEIPFSIDGYAPEEESSPAEQTAPAKPPEPMNPVNIRDILSPKAQLKVAHVYGKNVMGEAKNLAESSAIPTQPGIKAIEPASASADLSYHGVKELQTKPSAPTHRPIQHAGRLTVSNLPARQPQPINQDSTMAKTKKPAPAQYENRNRRTGDEFEPRNDRKPSRDQRGSGNRQMAALTSGRPADPEMLAAFLSAGIGAKVSNDRSGFLDSIRSKQNAPYQRREEALVDGENCINVSPAAETVLGKALRMAEQREFDYPGVGHFASLGGMYAFLTQIKSGNYHELAGAKANRALGTTQDYRNELDTLVRMSEAQAKNGAQAFYDWYSILGVMGDSIWLAVNQDPNLVQMLLENRLPLECFTWVRDRSREAEGDETPMRLRHDIHGTWYVPLLREVARTLKQRLRDFSNGVPAEKLPLPNFTQAVENSIKKLRTRMIRDVERKGQGWARPARTPHFVAQEAELPQAAPAELVQEAAKVDAELGLEPEPIHSVDDMTQQAAELAKMEAAAIDQAMVDLSTMVKDTSAINPLFTRREPPASIESVSAASDLATQSIHVVNNAGPAAAIAALSIVSESAPSESTIITFDDRGAVISTEPVDRASNVTWIATTGASANVGSEVIVDPALATIAAADDASAINVANVEREYVNDWVAGTTTLGLSTEPMAVDGGPSFDRSKVVLIDSLTPIDGSGQLGQGTVAGGEKILELLSQSSRVLFTQDPLVQPDPVTGFRMVNIEVGQGQLAAVAHEAAQLTDLEVGGVGGTVVTNADDICEVSRVCGVDSGNAPEDCTLSAHVADDAELPTGAILAGSNLVRMVYASDAQQMVEAATSDLPDPLFNGFNTIETGNGGVSSLQPAAQFIPSPLMPTAAILDGAGNADDVSAEGVEGSGDEAKSELPNSDV